MNTFFKTIQAFSRISLVIISQFQRILLQISFSVLTKAWPLIFCNIFTVQVVENLSQGISSNNCTVKHE